MAVETPLSDWWRHANQLTILASRFPEHIDEKPVLEALDPVGLCDLALGIDNALEDLLELRAGLPWLERQLVNLRRFYEAWNNSIGDKETRPGPHPEGWYFGAMWAECGALFSAHFVVFDLEAALPIVRSWEPLEEVVPDHDSNAEALEAHYKARLRDLEEAGLGRLLTDDEFTHGWFLP